MKFIDEFGKEAWDNAVASRGDSYMVTISIYAKRWAEESEKLILQKLTILDAIKQSKSSIDNITGGIDYVAFAAVCRILQVSWYYGDELWDYYKSGVI